MLPFKFRAWHRVHQAMIPWEVLQASMGGNEIRIPRTKLDVRHWGDIPVQEVSHLSLRLGNFFDSPDLLLMQFSGFQDKKGREIYQGDVISVAHYNPPHYAIDILEGGFCATHPDLDGYPIDLNHFNDDQEGLLDVEVAGTVITMPPFDRIWKERRA